MRLIDYFLTEYFYLAGGSTGYLVPDSWCWQHYHGCRHSLAKDSGRPNEAETLSACEIHFFPADLWQKNWALQKTEWEATVIFKMQLSYSFKNKFYFLSPINFCQRCVSFKNFDIWIIIFRWEEVDRKASLIFDKSITLWLTIFPRKGIAARVVTVSVNRVLAWVYTFIRRCIHQGYKKWEWLTICIWICFNGLTFHA